MPAISLQSGSFSAYTTVKRQILCPWGMFLPVATCLANILSNGKASGTFIEARNKEPTRTQTGKEVFSSELFVDEKKCTLLLVILAL